MNAANPNKNSVSDRSLLVIGVFVLTYLIVGYLTLDQTGRRVPIIAAGITLLLIFAEMLRARARFGEPGDADRAEGGGVKFGGSAGHELLAIAYVGFFVALIYFFGFLVAIPVYLFTSITHLGKQPLQTAIVVAAMSLFTIYVVFELVLSYRLFPGLFFD